jgi:hypothetical protein
MDYLLEEGRGDEQVWAKACRATAIARYDPRPVGWFMPLEHNRYSAIC